jgi:REP element-mobilizing transposase RayT
VHVVLKVRPEVGSLRTDERFQRIKQSLRDGCDRFGLRLLEFSIQDTHIHLVVEADDKRSLTRGMQGLAIRLAKGVNKVSGRKGPVFAERYFARPLKTVAEVRNAVSSLYANAQKHRGEPAWYIDPYSTACGEAWWWDETTPVVAAARTWLYPRALGRQPSS